MTKVFSTDRYILDLKKSGYNDNQINYTLEKWAGKCNGKTKKEINKMGLKAVDDWMMETNDKKKKGVR